LYCFGWQAGGLTTDERSEVILLGGKVQNSNKIFLSISLTLEDSHFAYLFVDLVLSNKLVVYDLDNEVIGWADHNCKYL